MRARTAILAATAIALTATSTPALAAKKKPIKYCNLMTDAKGDGTWNTASVVSSPALDIISADIATGKNELVAVLRVASTNTANDNWRTLFGYQWALGATGSGTKYEFSMRRGIGTNPSDIVTARVGDMNPPVKFQIVGNTFVWRIKRSDVPALRRPKLFWTDFGANTKVFSSTADDGFNDKTKYPDRGLSCVKAG